MKKLMKCKEGVPYDDAELQYDLATQTVAHLRAAEDFGGGDIRKMLW